MFGFGPMCLLSLCCKEVLLISNDNYVIFPSYLCDLCYSCWRVNIVICEGYELMHPASLVHME